MPEKKIPIGGAHTKPLGSQTTMALHLSPLKKLFFLYIFLPSCQKKGVISKGVGQKEQHEVEKEVGPILQGAKPPEYLMVPNNPQVAYRALVVAPQSPDNPYFCAQDVGANTSKNIIVTDTLTPQALEALILAKTISSTPGPDGKVAAGDAIDAGFSRGITVGAMFAALGTVSARAFGFSPENKPIAIAGLLTAFLLGRNAYVLKIKTFEIEQEKWIQNVFTSTSKNTHDGSKLNNIASSLKKQTGNPQLSCPQFLQVNDPWAKLDTLNFSIRIEKK